MCVKWEENIQMKNKNKRQCLIAQVLAAQCMIVYTEMVACGATLGTVVDNHIIHISPGSTIYHSLSSS
jgi:hypothetical protein